MHLLHTKSWHVKSAANIARVHRDEQEARQKQLQQEAQALAADRESRLELLRARSRHGGPSDQSRNISAASFLDPHPSDAVFVDDGGEYSTENDTQLHKDRHELTQYRTDDGHFNFFARPDTAAEPDLFGSGATKSSSRKTQDKHFSKSRQGDAASKQQRREPRPTEDDAFRLGGRPLDVPWYQRTVDDAPQHQDEPPARSAHRDWHDPIFDMGFSDRKRQLVDPRSNRSTKSSNDSEATSAPDKHTRDRSRSRDRPRRRRHDEDRDESMGHKEPRRLSREREKDKEKKDKSKSKSKRRNRSRSRSTSRTRRATGDRGASEFSHLREERLKREAIERLRVQKLMAANQSLLQK